MARPPLFQRATVTRIIKETADARTFVLAPHAGPMTYLAGQFCTFRVPVEGTELFRSYSMSSAPETDAELMTTVKRVAGGRVSNWLIDNLGEGDVVEMSRPAGRFCLRESTRPLLGFAGGSGITPILSLTKSTLATTDRRVRLLCADRDRASVIFDATLDDLVARYPTRLEVRRHLDADSGFLDPAAVRAFVGADAAGEHYICGPEAFMAMVETALPGPGAVYSERFGAAEPPPAAEPEPTVPPPAVTAGTVTVTLGRTTVTVPRNAGETLLESARRGGLTPPFSCEAGNCATCMATLTQGSATMRVNDALTDDEVAEGYVLTCQAIPDTAETAIRYE
ncbi:ferredoxin--NADP reductase [Nocardia mangyaensis]|uniref:ferredoxin--NADP reductase n=1 Tax=Nocardia mangyaensis TaxID=2213200 RepID=UPI002677112C|nr:ferredoxin--NADP reductase [Nocardia mangyaensis]MDO3646875.1 ferredoxin--NADP reductase [Nocardia mangyaensis]